MSFTSYAFRDNIVINNSKWIRWLNSSGTTRANILGVESNNVYLNSGSENLYINNDTNSYTFINNNNTNSVLIGSKLAIGINSTANINANLSIVSGGYIGSNVKNGNIMLSGTYSTSHTDGSVIKLYGNDSSNYGQIHLITGNHSSGHLNIYTGNNSLKMQIMNSGIINFSPNGSDTKVSISNDENIISNITKITNLTDSTDTSTGALQISGGLSVAKSLYVGQSLITGNLIYDNISYGNLFANSLGIGVSKTISGTFEASNNINSPTNITGLIFNSSNIRSFQGSLSVAIVRSSGGNLYETINFEANYTESNGWSIYTSSFGDVTGIVLSITSLGQIRYTSTNQNNWTSTIFRYVITYISNSNNYEGISITSGTFLVNSFQISDTTNAIINSQNGAFYSMGGGTFDKDLVVKGNIITTGGNVGIGISSPSYKLHVDGDIYAVGNVIAFSDLKMKKDISSINNALDKVSNLRGVEYTMTKTNEKNIGVIAQEVEKICPELVISKDNMKGVCYGNMVGLLIEAIKELNEKVEKLEKEKN